MYSQKSYHSYQDMKKTVMAGITGLSYIRYHQEESLKERTKKCAGAQTVGIVENNNDQ